MAITHANIRSLFTEIKFTKQGSIIKRQAQKKVKQLQAKVKERKERIAKIRSDNEITDADLIELLSEKARHLFSQQGSYTLTNKISHDNPNKSEEVTIAAGVINNINTENNLIGQELEHVQRLGILIRNINPSKVHSISFEELEYLDL